MPNPGADEPLAKITINIYNSDLLALKRLEGYGWSIKIRELVREYIDAQDSSTRALLWPARRRSIDE